jgi:transcription antitermination factor NusA-like protein
VVPHQARGARIVVIKQQDSVGVFIGLSGKEVQGILREMNKY